MRLLNRLYAFIFGYFWLPCPICRECFGGHERRGGALIDPFSEKECPDGSRTSTGKCVCKQCGGTADCVNSMPLSDRKRHWERFNGRIVIRGEKK
jgi:hypothetical protein